MHACSVLADIPYIPALTHFTYSTPTQDYMTKTHGKTLKLQQITVKVPGQRVSSVSKVTSTPTESIASDLADSLTVSLQPGDQSDHSRSNSPVQSETPLDVSYNSSHGRPGLRLTAPSFEYNSRDHRNHLTPEHEDFSSTEQFDEMGVYNPTTNHRSESHMTNGRGHNRNGSLDENVIMLQQLRTGGKYVLYILLSVISSIHVQPLVTGRLFLLGWS